MRSKLSSKMKEEKNFVLKGNDGLISDVTECHKLFIDGENRYKMCIRDRQKISLT